MTEHVVDLRVRIAIGLDEGVTLTNEALCEAAARAVHEAIIRARIERSCLQIAYIERAEVDLDKPSGLSTSSGGQQGGGE